MCTAVAAVGKTMTGKMKIRRHFNKLVRQFLDSHRDLIEQRLTLVQSMPML